MKTAFRRLLAAPVFSLTVTGSIALAAALVCSVFAIVQAAYLVPPPVRAPERLVDVWQTPSPASHQVQDYVQPRRAEEWVAGNDFRFLEGLAATGLGPEGVLVLGDKTVRVEVKTVLGDWFGLTGVQMARGRGLTPRDGRADAEAAAVVSHALWRNRLGERLGGVRLDDRIFQVVGVTSARLPAGESVWIPLAHAPAGMTPVAYAPVGRLRPGATIDQAREEIGQLAAAQVAADSTRYAGFGATVLRHGSTSRKGLPPSSWLVMGVLCLVLLLGLSNLVHLFLLRVHREATGLAVRGALGGSMLQVGSYLAWEAVLLSFAGCAAGVLLLVPGLDLAGRVLGSDVVLQAEPRIGAGALAAAAVAAVLVSSVLGLEALRFGRRWTRAPLARLGGGRLGSSREQRRFARGVLVAQTAASVVLVAAFLVLRTAHKRLSALEVGYDAEGVVMADPDFAVAGVPADGSWEVARRILEPLRRSSAREATAWRFVGMDYPPQPAWDVVVEGGTGELVDQARLYGFYEVDVGFFEALSVPVIDGRPLIERDHSAAAPVAVVTRSAAQEWWPGQPAVGRSFRIGDGPWVTVVGVSGDMQRLDWLGRIAAIRERPGPLVFVPAGLLEPLPTGWRVYDFWGDVKLAVRGVDPGADARTLQGAISAVAPGLPVERLGTMRDLQVTGDVWPELSRSRALVASGGAVALVLVLLGTFGLVAGSVQQRRGELGLRMALGAGFGSVVRTVTRESLRAAGLGLAVGAAGVGLLHHFVGPALFGYFGGRLTGGYGLGTAAAGLTAVIVAVCLACGAAARPARTLRPARILTSD